MYTKLVTSNLQKTLVTSQCTTNLSDDDVSSDLVTTSFELANTLAEPAACKERHVTSQTHDDVMNMTNKR